MMARLRSSPTSAAVVIPAHNESELLGGAVEAVLAAAAASTVPVALVVVLDSCTDGSGESLPIGVRVVRVARNNVGAARAAGFRAVRAAETGATWFATTDADSRVPAHWLERHLSYAAQGADMVAGTVRLMSEPGGDSGLRRRWEGEYRSEDDGPHVHGANLGFRDDLYWRLGGFRDLATGEDVDLVRRFETAGATITWARDVAVATSGRLAGRAQHGFAEYLLRLSDAGEARGPGAFELGGAT